MCGRYYVDDETAKEIEKIIRIVDEKSKETAVGRVELRTGDIHPAEYAPVLRQSEKGVCLELQKWGFPGFDNKQIVFNARSESVLDKKMFQESVERRRVVVPAAGFYEWNKNREKSTFIRKDRPVLYMAGVYSRYSDGNRFVILTTAANSSMKPVHDRMPLILEEDEIVPWLSDRERAEELLKKVPCLLGRTTEFEQMRRC